MYDIKYIYIFLFQMIKRKVKTITEPLNADKNSMRTNFPIFSRRDASSSDEAFQLQPEAL